MRNIFALTLAASVITFSSTVALADPIEINLEIQCPIAQNQSNMLSNYGDFIAGYGLERIKGQGDFSIYFKSNASIKGVPSQLENYFNSGVKYTSTTGDITCEYSSNAGEPSFEVIYTLTNGKGGKAISLGTSRINVLIPFGLKA